MQFPFSVFSFFILPHFCYFPILLDSFLSSFPLFLSFSRYSFPCLYPSLYSLSSVIHFSYSLFSHHVISSLIAFFYFPLLTLYPSLSLFPSLSYSYAPLPPTSFPLPLPLTPFLSSSLLLPLTPLSLSSFLLLLTPPPFLLPPPAFSYHPSPFLHLTFFTFPTVLFASSCLHLSLYVNLLFLPISNLSSFILHPHI